MNTHSLASAFSFPKSFIKDFSSGHDHHHGKSKQVDDNKYFNRLAEDRYQPAKVDETVKPGVVNSEMAVQSQLKSIEHSAEIQVVTQEGDVITISLSEAAENKSGMFQMEQGSGSISAYGESSSRESKFDLTIEGDLNKKEEKALSKLIRKMTRVTDKFFKGNVNAAFKHAQKIGFNSNQIASFSMDLNKNESVQAVAAYQQISMPEENVDPDMLKTASNFLAETKAFLADSKATLESLAEPKQSFTDLFAGMGQLQYGVQNDSEDLQSDAALFSKMIENISLNIFED